MYELFKVRNTQTRKIYSVYGVDWSEKERVTYFLMYDLPTFPKQWIWAYATYYEPYTSKK